MSDKQPNPPESVMDTDLTYKLLKGFHSDNKKSSLQRIADKQKTPQHKVPLCPKCGSEKILKVAFEPKRFLPIPGTKGSRVLCFECLT